MKAVRFTALAIVAAMPLASAGAQEQRVKLTPINADDALMEFTRVCLRNFPSAAKIRDAIGKSPHAYAPTAANGGQQWRSAKAVVGLVVRNKTATKCDFDAILAEKIEPGVLAGQVQNRLERELGNRPPYRQVGQAIVWEWSFGAVTRVLTIDFASADRQLALSLTSTNA